jgi:hypothetical protein
MRHRSVISGEFGYVALLLGAPALALMLWQGTDHGDSRRATRAKSTTLIRPAPAEPAVEPAPVSLELPGAERRDPEPDRRVDTMSQAGQRARGLYYSGMRVHYLGAKRMAQELKRSRLNAAVIDLKDGEGLVTYDTAIEALRPQRKIYIEDAAALTDALHREGIYAIARIVCFTDPSLPRREPSRAVLDARPGHEGEPWANWGKRNTWLDPFNAQNHELVLALAREAEALGFDEIQFDYFRFPVDPAADFARFPADDGRPRHEVLAALLARVDAELSIPIGVDVFGANAFKYRSVAALGQNLKAFLPHVEALSPMLYVNGMQTLVAPGVGRAERGVGYAVNRLRAELGPGVVLRPFLQAFANGADYYTPEFIDEQVRGVARNEGDGYLFWHVNSDYSLVHASHRALHPAFTPFHWERPALGERVAAADRR